MPRARTTRVNIIQMVKVNGKWAFAPIVVGDGKIIRDYVQINGKEEHHPEGRYYLDWYESGMLLHLACAQIFVMANHSDDPIAGPYSLSKQRVVVLARQIKRSYQAGILPTASVEQTESESSLASTSVSWN